MQRIKAQPIPSCFRNRNQDCPDKIRNSDPIFVGSHHSPFASRLEYSSFAKPGQRQRVSRQTRCVETESEQSTSGQTRLKQRMTGPSSSATCTSGCSLFGFFMAVSVRTPFFSLFLATLTASKRSVRLDSVHTFLFLHNVCIEPVCSLSVWVLTV